VHLPTNASVHRYKSDSDSESEQSSDDDEGGNNTYFHVQDAEPPTNYEDAYSTLPTKIKLATIKKDISSSIKFKKDVDKEKSEMNMDSKSQDSGKRKSYTGKKTYPSEREQFWLLID